MAYTDHQIRFIKIKRDEGYSWQEIADMYKSEFEEAKTPNSVRKVFHKYEGIDISDNSVIKNLELARRSSAENKRLKKEKSLIVDKQLSYIDILNAVKSLLDSRSLVKAVLPKLKSDKKKKNMIMECDFADPHFGKRGKADVIRNRILKYRDTILSEIKIKESNFNLKEIVVPFLGDLIENSNFHGTESMESSDCQNSEQIRIGIEVIFKDFLKPLFLTGYKFVLPCVTGNHCRYSQQVTFNDPGKNHLSWVIYNCLQMLTEASGFKNVTFIIPEGVYCTYEIFGDLVLFEHGNFVKGKTEESYEAHIHKRSKQIGKNIKFFRMGHFHKGLIQDRGRVIICGSICGRDSYSEVNGYSSQPTQTITYYIEHQDVYPDSYYYSFPIFLGE